MLGTISTESLPEVDSPEEKLLRQLCSIVDGYLEKDQVESIVRAYHYGADAHSGQFRKSGEAYICHPLSVAITLAEMRMDMRGIISAILHDVIEDTAVSKDQLASEFSDDVANLVDGVTKLTKLDNKSHAEAQAENVRKMLLAMAKDLRVIIVKLADRLHNMQTLGAMPTEKKRRIAKETQEIYVPLANRLSMNSIRHELEALCLQTIHPHRYKTINEAVKKARGNRREIVNTIENSIKNRLSQLGLIYEVTGREKNIASIYKKMRRQKISFSNVFDVYAFRIYCDQVDDCYRILGCVHNLFKPIPGKFKDYIALPKANGYQSLHTILIGHYGVPIEIQIRTHEMHRMAESGIAAHWLYKSKDMASGESAQAKANEWLTELLEMQQTAGDSLEFIDNLKVDLFPQEVFVFTPQGTIIKLPRGATIIDFAYSVHTDIGNACISARIDNKLIPLQTQLENGMTIEVITASWARPNPLWLNSIITAKARSSIRNYLKNFKQKEAIDLGSRLLKKELEILGLKLEEIAEDRLEQLLSVLKIDSVDYLLEEIGLGNKMPILVAKRLSQEDIHAAIKLDDSNDQHAPLIIKGTEGMVITLAKCCHPIPGDHIIGFFNPGKGIVIHHHECRNSNEARKKQTSRIDVEWSQDASGEFSVELRIELLNQRGTLATIASTISAMDSNIEAVSIVEQDDKVCIDLITLTVKDRVHLASIIRKLKKLFIILKITRIKA